MKTALLLAGLLAVLKLERMNRKNCFIDYRKWAFQQEKVIDFEIAYRSETDAIRRMYN